MLSTPEELASRWRAIWQRLKMWQQPPQKKSSKQPPSMLFVARNFARSWQPLIHVIMFTYGIHSNAVQMQQTTGLAPSVSVAT